MSLNVMFFFIITVPCEGGGGGGQYMFIGVWVPKIGNCKTLLHPIFQGRTRYSQIRDKNMHLLIEIRHYFHRQFHRNYIEVKKKPIIRLKWTFSKNNHNDVWVSWRTIFESLGVQKTPRRPAG